MTAISPYTEAVDAAEHRFVAESGIETIVGAHLGNVNRFRLAEPKPEAILELALGDWDPQSDGLIAACLNFRSHPVIEDLEADRQTGRRFDQMALRRLLRLAGVDTLIDGFGQLMQEF